MAEFLVSFKIMNTLPNKPNLINSDKMAENSATKNRTENPAWAKAVYFPEWREHLMLEPFDDSQKARFIRAIATFFAHCKAVRKLSSIGVAKAYLEAGREQGKCSKIDQDALHWFFVTYRKEFGNDAARHYATAFPEQPMPIPKDTPEWEAALIRAIRLRGFQWNTEKIYRGCLRRFAEAIRPMAPDQAGIDEVRQHLTDLAVQRQLSRSGQKQALNALVL